MQDKHLKTSGELLKYRETECACNRHPLAGGACVQTTEVQDSIVTSKRQRDKLEGKVFLKKHFVFIKDFDKNNENISGKLSSC